MATDENKKRAIYDQMSLRGRKYIDKIGYDQWDPFQEPKDPIDIRKDVTNRTANTLYIEFIQSITHKTSQEYERGVQEMCHGMINTLDKYIGMLEFSLWYNELLKNENKKI